MLTSEQLAELKARNITGLNYGDYELMLGEIARLTRHNQRMSAALAQLSDKENWTWIEGDEGERQLPGLFMWEGGNDPQQLAERALVEDQ